jgi:invasion protein IalB
MEMIVPGTNWKAKFALATLSTVFFMSGHGVARSDDDKQQVHVSSSRWTKICIDDRNSDQRGCLTGEEGRIDSGQRVIAAVVIERAGEKSLLRIVLPLGMQLVHGTRLIVDNNKPTQAPYIKCQAAGCISEYELTSDLRDHMKRGKNLIVQAINSNGAPLTLPLPLAGFQNALSGSPSAQADIERDRPVDGKKPPADYLADPGIALLPTQKPGASGNPSLAYAPWIKVCLKGQDTGAKQVCFTGKDGRIESGDPLVAAVVIEPEGEPKKTLRVTLPLGMDLVHGTRLVIDSNPAMQSPYVICFANGCMSDYEVTPELLTNLKQGQNLVVEAIGSAGTPLNLPLPLAEFAEAYNGPPMDSKVFEENNRKLKEDLQRRAAAKAAGRPSPTAAPAPASPPPAPQMSATTPGRIAPAGRRVALVIGNSAYKAMPILKNPTNDATDVGAALKSVGFETVIATDVTRAEMNNVVDRFSRIADGADVALVYYSGHGMQFGGKNYLLPIDADLQSLADINRYRLLPVDDLVDILQSAKGPQLIVLDACRNNPVERDFKNKFVSASGSLTRDGSVSRGFERIDARNGLVVVYSTASNSVAADGPDRNSPFTKVFLKDVATPDVEFRQMLFRVQSEVYEATKQQQLPEISSLYIGPDVRLVTSAPSTK